MSWVEIRKKGLKQIYLVTDEAYKDVFMAQGFEIVNNAQNNASTAKEYTVQANTQPEPQTPHKRQYTKRTSVSDNK